MIRIRVGPSVRTVLVYLLPGQEVRKPRREENYHTEHDQDGDEAPRDVDDFLGAFVEKKTHRWSILESWPFGKGATQRGFCGGV